MYSTVGLLKNAKRSGRLIGTHQKLDRVARRKLSTLLTKDEHFPGVKEILKFEGMQGPDGLKRKSPGVDDPMHFIEPGHDNGELRKLILNHHHNLHRALKGNNRSYEGIFTDYSQIKSNGKPDEVRAAFEAAWLAHVVTDGLTPAHHYPYQSAVKEMMSDREYVKIFGQPMKGIMRGRNFSETAKNNWQYWGPEGYMTKHIAFEYGAAVMASTMTGRAMLVKVKLNREDLLKMDFMEEFYRSLDAVHQRDIYSRFRRSGWTTELANECHDFLLPEMVRMIIIAWFSAIPRSEK